MHADIAKRAEALGLDLSKFTGFRLPEEPAPTIEPISEPAEPEVSAHEPDPDDNLIMAVALATSWRGVARGLGYRTNSGATLRNIRDRTAKLGLSTDHFTGKRRWSDAQLKDAIETAGSWSAVAENLGIKNTSENRKTIEINAQRLSLDLKHFEALEDEPRQTIGEPQLERLREAATTIASAWFMLRGFTPSLPMEARPYDLLVDMKGKVQRVQVKTCMASAGQVVVAPRAAGVNKNGPRLAYSPEDVDLFFILDGDLTIFLIPIIEIIGKQAINLRGYRRFRVGSASSLLS